MKKGISPVFTEVGDLRKHRDNREVERFVEGILRTRGEMPVSQFTSEYPSFEEQEVMEAAERLPSVDIRQV